MPKAYKYFSIHYIGWFNASIPIGKPLKVHQYLYCLCFKGLKIIPMNEHISRCSHVLLQHVFSISTTLIYALCPTLSMSNTFPFFSYNLFSHCHLFLIFHVSHISNLFIISWYFWHNLLCALVSFTFPFHPRYFHAIYFGIYLVFTLLQPLH